jgi:hypothetical protein
VNSLGVIVYCGVFNNDGVNGVGGMTHTLELVEKGCLTVYRLEMRKVVLLYPNRINQIAVRLTVFKDKIEHVLRM